MARSSKWIKGTRPDQPVSRAARLALRLRLKAVWSYAKLAAKHAEEDIEHVHLLRVSSRRAEMALEVFGELLPAKQSSRIRRRLKSLRRAAGNARDLDVLGARLVQVVKNEDRAELGLILTEIRALRIAAQRQLRKSYQQAKRKRFRDRCRAALKGVGWRGKTPEPRFDAVAGSALKPLLEQFFAPDIDLNDPKALHQWRICGKHVRYAMELLAGAFAPGFRRECYPAFKEIQEQLGEINDRAVAVTIIRECMETECRSAELARACEVFLAEQESEMEAACQEFRGAWTGERAADLKGRFDRFVNTVHRDPVCAGDGKAGGNTDGQVALQEPTPP